MDELILLLETNNIVKVFDDNIPHGLLATERMEILSTTYNVEIITTRLDLSVILNKLLSNSIKNIKHAKTVEYDNKTENLIILNYSVLKEHLSIFLSLWSI